MITRTLSLVALLAVPASAQDVRILPGPDAARPRGIALERTAPRDCEGAAARRLPLSDTPRPVPMPEADLDGPAPAPMPNLCAEGDGLTAEAGADRLLDRLRLYRFRDAPGLPNGLRDADPFELRDRWLPYPDLHGPALPLRFDRPPLPDVEIPSDLLDLPPVAPPGDRP